MKWYPKVRIKNERKIEQKWKLESIWKKVGLRVRKEKEKDSYKKQKTENEICPERERVWVWEETR